MPTAITSTDTLPASERGTRYIRCDADKTALIDCMEGHVFTKADGTDWPHDGYEVKINAITRLRDTRVLVPRIENEKSS